MECALPVLSRAYWQEGYPQFLDAATYLKMLVESSNTFDFQRRVEYVCLSHPRHDLMPVCPFVDSTGQLLLSPALRGDPTGGKYVGEWQDVARDNLSLDELASMKSTAVRLRELSPYITRASHAVVRLFGYHAGCHDGDITSTTRLRVVPCTAFFVSPIHLLTARTNRFCAETNTYAYRFAFSSNTRASLGMLTPDVDLIECHEVPEQVAFLAETIRDIGVLVNDQRMPNGLQSTPWCDLMLLEVTNKDRHTRLDTQYLLPEMTSLDVVKGEPLFALHYPNQPSAEYLTETFGSRGYNSNVTENELRGQMWSYDTKMCSMGAVLEEINFQRVLKTNCTLLPGSRGAPILRNVYVDFDNDAAKRKSVGEDSAGLEFAATYCAMAIGRSRENVEKERDHIISMSTSDLARTESLGANMYNDCTPVHNTCLVLLYLKYVLPAITNEDHRLYISRFLHPYGVLVSRSILSQCHRKMLKDADDYNEYGMDFYEHHDLQSALQCFREGAKMFTTASIPNLTDFEIELRTALQTNVSAVVVAMKENPQPK
ncbi:Hypothetical protein, putative [Bodo saltans]|uniref:Uncharacterized protein n=1 Tax=Bodo saltans TaxID=75058 RepID=A0A0S4KFP5_BODSA|nr:Hypothetical protein, putative [Bodo saltans]|eukprot:CUI14509.1 Hypothetical protein, putative [Bodo saltans]